MPKPNTLDALIIMSGTFAVSVFLFFISCIKTIKRFIFQMFLHVIFIFLQFTIELNACNSLIATENRYKHFIPLKLASDEHLAELQLFVRGERDCHIALTTTDQYNRYYDVIYEIRKLYLFIYLCYIQFNQNGILSPFFLK